MNVIVSNATPRVRITAAGGTAMVTLANRVPKVTLSPAGTQGPPGVLSIEARTDDPVNPPVGRVWMRTDL